MIYILKVTLGLVIHKNAKIGAGGVGFFVKNELFAVFDTFILKQSYEGIL